VCKREREREREREERRERRRKGGGRRGLEVVAGDRDKRLKADSDCSGNIHWQTEGTP
jgi:hypothetical protein